MKPGGVDLAPLQERFRELQEQGVPTATIARRMGYFRTSGAADITRVKRDLGLVHQTTTRNYPVAGHRVYHYFRKSVTPALALRLADALGLAPVEIGL